MNVLAQRNGAQAMIKNRRQVAVLLWALLMSGEAFAADGAECFSPATKFNVCERARQIQAELAPQLPMTISSQMTLVSAHAFGKRVTVVANWNLTKAQLDEMVRAEGLASDEMTKLMQQMTTNNVCSGTFMAPFIRSGGQIEYTYRSIDFFRLYSPIVTTCPQ